MSARGPAHRHARLGAGAVAGAPRRGPDPRAARRAGRGAGAHQDRGRRAHRRAAVAGGRPRVLHARNRPRAARRHGGHRRAQPQGPVDAARRGPRAGGGARARGSARCARSAAAGRRSRQLPPGARVGTSSLRRRAFLRRARPDLRCWSCAATCRRASSGCSGGELRRDRAGHRGPEAPRSAAHITRVPRPRRICRRRYRRARSACAHAPAMQRRCGGCGRWMTPRRALAVTAERALLRRIAGRLPGAARRAGDGRRGAARAAGERLCARWLATAVSARGSRRAGSSGATRGGARRARRGRALLARGAAELIAQQRATHARWQRRERPWRCAPVVVTRDEAADGPLSRELREPRAAGAVVAGGECRALRTPARSLAALAAVQSFGWIVFASRHAVAAVLEQLSAAPAGRAHRGGRTGAPRRCCANAAGRSTWCRTKRTPRRWWPPSPRAGARQDCRRTAFSIRPARAHCRRSPRD